MHAHSKRDSERERERGREKGRRIQLDVAAMQFISRGFLPNRIGEYPPHSFISLSLPLSLSPHRCFSALNMKLFMMRHFHQQFVKIHAYMHFLAVLPPPHSTRALPLLATPWRYFINLLSRPGSGSRVCVGSNEWQTKPGDDNTNRM